MEIVHPDGTPLAAYLKGEGYLDPALKSDSDGKAITDTDAILDAQSTFPFSPSRNIRPASFIPKISTTSSFTEPSSRGVIRRIHNACSTAVNSRLGRADNARFLEHFRYIIVASQLLNEYLNQGALPPPSPVHNGLDGTSEATSRVSTSLYGAALTAIVAFSLVFLIHWARNSRDAVANKNRIATLLAVLVVVGTVGYAYLRRQWLKHLRRNAVTEVTALTANWQTFEISSSAALSLIQEVELVSKGYGLSTPLPPASRIENHALSRRCIQLRKALANAYTAIISTTTDAGSSLRQLIDEAGLDKYCEVYDVNVQDAKDASEWNAWPELEDDLESMKSLRLLSYRTSVLRRVVLCSLLALEADGGKPDFHRWRLANDAMSSVLKMVGSHAEKLQRALNEMETVPIPTPTTSTKFQHTSGNGKLRSQVRKISMLSSGIRTLQAKMQVLREETNRSIEQSDDLAELGPSLILQYESIGEDLAELMRAWESGKAALQLTLTRQEERMSLGSSVRSPPSSLGGLTAVDEDGGPAAALKALTGGVLSNRSSIATSRSEDEVFEAVAVPTRQRSTLTREERIANMQEERERQATLRAKRDTNNNMMRELESVIRLRPKTARVTSV